MKTIRYINKPNNIFKKENFILSALNLAFLSYYYDHKFKITKNLVLWPDGIFSKFFINSKKIPGSQLIKDLKLNKSIKEIKVVGNLNQKSLKFLKEFHFLIFYSQLVLKVLYFFDFFQIYFF